MKHLTLEEKYNIIKQACIDYSEEIPEPCSVGIHNFGLLHIIADSLDMKGNTGRNLRSIWSRTVRIMRALIKAGYSISEGRIKSCSWSSRESWHPAFFWEERDG